MRGGRPPGGRSASTSTRCMTPDRDLLAADRADAVVGDRLGRLPADVAVAMAVQVILTLFGEKLDRTRTARRVAAAQRVEQRIVRQLDIEQRGFTPQLWRRMRIRIGNQRVTVQVADTPVHRRIGRQPRLEGKDVRRQVAKTLFDRVKARLGPQHRKPRRPDVRGNQVAAFVDPKHDLQQVTRVQPQDRSPVRTNIADPFQRSLDALDNLQRGRKDDVVHLARGAVALVDIGDLACQHKTHHAATGAPALPVRRGSPPRVSADTGPLQPAPGWRAFPAASRGARCRPCRPGVRP